MLVVGALFHFFFSQRCLFDLVGWLLYQGTLPQYAPETFRCVQCDIGECVLPGLRGPWPEQ